MIETIRSISDYINDGDWIESKDQSTCGIRLLQTGNIGNTRYLEKASRSKYISEETFERMRCSEIFAGDILISRLPDPVGRACIVPENLGKAITAVDCTIVRVNKEKCLPEYLLYYTDSPVYRHQVNKYLLGATRIRISRKNLETIQVPLPDITDQENIVSNFLKVDALIDKIHKQLELMDQLVKSRFIECFGDMYLNSKGWPEANLESMAGVVSGITKGRKTRNEDLTEVPYMAVSNVKDGYIDWTTVKTIEATQQEIEQYRLLPDDVLMTEGGDPDKVGRGAIIKEPLKNCIHQNHIFRVRLDESVLLPEFFAEYLQHQRAKRYFLGCAKQTTGIASINMKQLRALPVLVPPMAEQTAFVSFKAETDKSKLAVQKSLQELETLKKSLMQKYFG